MPNKKRIAAFVCCFILLPGFNENTYSASSIKGDLLEEDLDGDVRSISVWEFKNKNNSDQGNKSTKTLVYKKTFDKKGNLLVHISYTLLNSHVLKIVYSYNESGDMIRKLSFDNGVMKKKHIFKYLIGSEGKIQEKRSYDTKGLLTSRIIYSDLPDRVSEEVIYYDENGDSHNRFLVTCHSLKPGKMIEFLSFNKKGILISKSTELYDDNDRMIEYSIYDEKKLTLAHRITYKYILDDKRRVTKKLTYNIANQLIHNSEYKFDQSGNMIHGIEINYETGESYQVRFEYDKKGNWIKMIKGNANVVVRQISYHSK